MIAAAVQNKSQDLNLKGILLLALVFLIIVPPVYWFIHWRVAFGLLLIAPLIARIFFIPAKLSRVFIYVYAIYFLSFVGATWLQSQLAINPKFVSFIRHHRTAFFFLTGGEYEFNKQVLFSIVAGILFGFLVVNIPLWTTILISSEFVLALRKNANIDWRTALRYLWSLVMGINYPWLIVEDGEITESKPKGVLADMGGPGNIVLRPGNVVVLQKHGQITQIAAPGLIPTRRFEQIRAIVELKPMWTSNILENVLTKDRIPLRVTFGVGYQIEPKSEVDKRPDSHTPPDGVALTPLLSDGVYEVYEASIRKAVFDTASDWQTTSVAFAENLLRDTVATYYFDQIFRKFDEPDHNDGPGGFNPNERTISEIEEKIKEKHKAIASAWGVHTRALDIKIIELPEKAGELMLDWWRAGWQKRVTDVQADALRRTIEQRGRGEAQALTDIENARMEACQRLLDSVTTNIAGIVRDQIQEDSSATIEQFLGALEAFSRAMAVADTSTAIRYVEALEKMADESGTKVLVVGEEGRMLPRLLGSSSEADDAG